MTRYPLIACCLLAACRGTPPSASVPVPAPGSVAITCEQYFQHAADLTNFTQPWPLTAEEQRLCHAHTDEQLRCSLAATTIDDMNLCDMFSDPSRRAVAQGITASIKASWPGSAPLMKVLVDTNGCGFGGLLGTPQVALSDTDAAPIFALRDATTQGDPPNIIAKFHRATKADAWQCVTTDPPGLCATLEQACKPAR